MSAFIGQFLENMLKMRLACSTSLPEGYNYHGLEDYVLDRGVHYASTPLTRDERSIVQAAKLNAIDRSFQPKQCFYNAQLLAVADETRTLAYCEGFACSGIMPLHHGWCVINGKVVDLTWRQKPQGPPIMGTFGPEWGYVGVTFDTDALRSEILRTSVVKSRLDDYENDFPLFKQPRAVR